MCEIWEPEPTQLLVERLNVVRHVVFDFVRQWEQLRRNAIIATGEIGRRIQVDNIYLKCQKTLHHSSRSPINALPPQYMTNFLPIPI